MRKILVATLSVFVMSCAPVMAAKYDCEMFSDNVSKKTCEIDSAATDTCVYKPSSNLTVTCAAGDPVVGCVFHNGPLTAAEISDEFKQLATPEDAKLAKAAKGFQAVAIGIGAVVIGYVEKQGATKYVAVCNGK